MAKPNDGTRGLSALLAQKPGLQAELQISNVTEAGQVVNALIRFERTLRKKNNAIRVGPWSGLAVRVAICRQKLQEDAGLVATAK